MHVVPAPVPVLAVASRPRPASSVLPSDPAVCYRALQARDARFDGLFFVGVRTTGIYCRPVCRARTPRPTSCTFFPAAAAAERAGFRPCLLCRPETAPGTTDDGSLERALLAHLRAGAPQGKTLAALTAGTGYSGRQLRRLLRGRFGVGPVEIVQTERLLFAKRLLQETALPVIEVARSAGFRSLRRFNALFRERYRLTPTRLRKAMNKTPPGDGHTPSDFLSLRLTYRPPLAWSELLGYLARRAVPGVETVTPDDQGTAVYARSVALGEHVGVVCVRRRPDGESLNVEVPAQLSPVLPEILTRLRRLFDLDANPGIIAEHLAGAGDERLAVSVHRRPGLRVPGAWDPFELALRAILGQQVSVTAATTLAGRVARRFGRPLPMGSASPATWPVGGAIAHLAPDARSLAAADPGDLAALGLTRARAEAVVALARATVAGALDFPAGTTTHAQAVAALKTIRGVGEWTAQYVALRALRFPDAFPDGDLGLRKALAGPGEPPVSTVVLRAHAERWRPWRAYAVLHLWESLG